MPKVNAHENHRERMRKRFAERGFDNYRPHEVLEQLLFGCLPRVNTNEIGHRLIDSFGSVMGVLDASVDELMRVDGIGIKSAEYIASIKPNVGNVIAEQYRTMGAVTHGMAVFLSDWFFTSEENMIGLIVCDHAGVFRECCEISLQLKDGSPDCEKIASEIIGKVGEGKYIAVLPSSDAVSRSDAYRLLDITSQLGCVMMNAYRKVAAGLTSVLF